MVGGAIARPRHLRVCSSTMDTILTDRHSRWRRTGNRQPTLDSAGPRSPA